MTKMKSLGCILAILGMLMPPGAAGRGALPAGGKGADVALEGYKPQVVRGKSAELKAFGKSFPIQSVEIIPADGITIGEIKEGTPTPGNRRQQEKDVKVWSLPLTVTPSAQLGERSLVFVTPQGRSEAATLVVVTHRPVITALEIVSTNRYNAEVKVKLTVEDEAGDIGPSPSVSWMLGCGGGGVFGSLSFSTFPVSSEKTRVIEASLAQQGASSSGSCDFSVSVQDSSGNESPELSRQLEFK